MSELRFTWHEAKAAANLRNHKVSFEEAKTVFSDERAQLIDDPDHSVGEERFVLLGLSASLKVLLVCHCYRETGNVAADVILDHRADVKVDHLKQDGGFWPPMLTQEQTVEISVLARQGQSIRAIARQTGLSRQSVRKYLESGAKPAYGPREPRPTKLDGVRSYLLRRIEAARPDWIPSSVLYREARERGYDGCSSQLRAWVRQFKPQSRVDPVVRFETDPGVQMQADFTHVRKGRDPLLALVATLGYSRASFVRFARNEDADTLVACLTMAFEYFGGVPEQVLFDNAKSVIIERDHYGEGQHRWNSKLLELSDQYGFALTVCRPYRAKTKGKVERFNGYVKPSFVLPLSVTLRQAGLSLDCETANAHVGRWLEEVANSRIHGTTLERPCDRMVVERQHLLALPRSAVWPSSKPVEPAVMPIPFESLQHPLSMYDELLAEAT